MWCEFEWLHVSFAQENLVSTHASPSPLLTVRLSPLHRREDRNCAPSLPELKSSTDTPHGTQTGLRVRTAPDVETRETCNNEIDQPNEPCQHNSSGFLSFLHKHIERSFIEHKVNWPGRQHVPAPTKCQHHSSTKTMLVPSQICNICQKRL